MTDTQRGAILSKEHREADARRRIIAEWDAAIARERAKGLPKSKALAAVAREQPLLHAIWINTRNNRPLCFGL